MATYPFLSDEWITAARAVREQHGLPGTPPPTSVRMNLVIDEVPFGQGSIEAHLDTTSGTVEIDLGHLEHADVRVSLGYEIAKSILIDADAERGMQAFMAGLIRVEGDLTKLLQFQSTPLDPRQLEIANEIRALTA